MKMRKLTRMMIPQGYLRKSTWSEYQQIKKSPWKIDVVLDYLCRKGLLYNLWHKPKIKLRMCYCVLTFVKKYSTFFQVNVGVIPGLINSCNYNSTSRNNITHLFSYFSFCFSSYVATKPFSLWPWNFGSHFKQIHFTLLLQVLIILA